MTLPQSVLHKLSFFVGDGTYTLDELSAMTGSDPEELRNFYRYGEFDPLDISIVLAIPTLLQEMNPDTLSGLFDEEIEEPITDKEQCQMLTILRLCSRISFDTKLSHEDIYDVIGHYEKEHKYEFDVFRNLKLDCPEITTTLAHIGYSVVGVIFKQASEFTDQNVRYAKAINRARNLYCAR